MNQPGTAAYLAAIRRTAPSTALLVQIDLTIPSARTLRFSSRGIGPVDGYSWEEGLEGEAIRDAIEYLGAGPNLVSWKCSIANKTLSDGGGGARLDTLLASYQWRRARIRAYSWETSLTSFADALPLFDGRILYPKAEGALIVLQCTQSFDWDKTIPAHLVDIVTAPNAPDSAMGVPYPIVLGAHTKPPLISPFSAGYLDEHDQSGGGRLAVPLIVTDPGTGANNVKAIAAGHLLKKLFDPTDGHAAFMPGSGSTLAPILTTGASETLGASESYLSIDDGQLVAYAAVLPSQVATAAASVNNSADGPRLAMTPHNLSQFASIDQTAGKNALVLMLPNVGSLGTIVSVEAMVGFSQLVDNPANRLRIRPCNVATGTYGTAITSGLSLGIGSGLALRGAWDTGFYNSNWQFSDGGANPNAAIVVDYTGGAIQKTSIYWACLVVKFKPARSVVGQSHTTGLKTVTIKPNEQATPGVYIGDPNLYITVPVDVPNDINQLDSPLYANVEGAPDDGSGTYTGSAAALVERPSDLVRWLLTEQGGLSAGDFETSAGEHGSFVDARTAVKDGWPGEFKLAPYIGRQIKLSDAIKDICAQSLCSVVLDRFTGKWRFGVWKLGARADYDLTFRWDIIELVSAETLTNLDSVQEVRVQYGYDHFTGRTLFETFVSPAGSSTGYNTPTTRDQKSIVISAANQYVDFALDASTSAASVANATYTDMMTLAKAIRDAMNTSSGTTTAIAVGYGLDVKASYNDSLRFTVGGTPYTATLTAGKYPSGDAFAIELQRAMNAAGSGLTFTATYSPATSGFTVTGSSAWAVADDGAGHLSIGWATVGYAYPAAAATSRGTDFPRYLEHFWWQVVDTTAFGGHATITLKWGTGTHTATNCALDVGFARADGSASADQSASYGRGLREIVAASALSDYGPHEPDQFVASAVNDEETAVRIRNRRFDLRTIDRVIVVFRTTFAPDLQRLRHIQFDASLDAHRAFPRYGSDGSWAGKVFKVISVLQYPHDAQHHSEITAIEV